ncbi:MAG: S8 family serine peptidase [Calditrichaceae bacterium]
MLRLLLFALIFLILSVHTNLYAQQTEIERYIEKTDKQIIPVWIYFKDKGPHSDTNLRKQTEYLTERAVTRRLKVRPAGQLYDYDDIPVNETYINMLLPFAAKVRIRSKWLNAVSIDINRDDISELNRYEFIDRVTPVLGYQRNEPESGEVYEADRYRLPKGTGEIDYGSSITQLAQIQVPVLHTDGLNGEGVLICMLDDGFAKYDQHIVFDSLKVMGTWDFINNDETVDDNDGSGKHGTKTLSTIAGYAQGELIGPAYKATFLLGKTEDDFGETPVEEDYWVAGLEWAENQGADIVSSSLGYIDWYTPDDMDGVTAVTTIAADKAVNRGLIVVNSAGNEGFNASQNTLIAPADGKNVIAVGGVLADGTRWGGSSVGPTADGRIKPDMAAMSSGVKVASDFTTTSFTTASGTSFSCPLVAGSIALLLQAFPDLTPAQVVNSLKATASQSHNPDKLLGWGIVNMTEAYNFASWNYAGGGESPDLFLLGQNYPNPFNYFTVIRFSVVGESRVTIDLYDILGRKVRKLYDAVVSGRGSKTIYGNDLASGIYFYRIVAKDLVSGKESSLTRKMIYVK